MQRVLAEEGVTLISDPSNGNLVAEDDLSRSVFHDVSAPFRSGAGFAFERAEHAVHTMDIKTKLVPEAATLRAYDERNPNMMLEARAATSKPFFARRESQREVYRYESRGFTDSAHGRLRADLRSRLSSLDEERISCEASFTLPVGAHLKIVDGPLPLPEQLLVRQARSRWAMEAPQRQSTLELTIPERHAPVAPEKPRIHGTQRAFVRGAEGMPIDVDEEGRVEVEFRWDRRDARAAGALRRVRVAQGWAGASYGLGAVPRVGDEVLVTFLDGDPDEPLIVGRLHNAAAPGPLKLPEERGHTVLRTESTPGGGGYNEFRLIDDAGAELIKLRAERDIELLAQNDARRTVGVDDHLRVGGAQTQQVQTYKDTVVGKGTRKAVGADGSSTSSGGPISINCPSWSLATGARTDTATEWQSTAGTHKFVTTGDFEVAAGQISLDALGGGHIDIEAGRITLQMGGAKIEMLDGSIELAVGGSSILVEDAAVTIISALIDLNP
jgi:type VI secretion system secreted protein VgrG